jgi:long-subunit acyl-CoA synthetase (AMP-forming)
MQPLLVSSQNSEAASLHVLKATKCSKFVYSDKLQREVQSLQRKNRDMQIWEVPSLWRIFGSKAKSYPYKKSFADVEDQTAVIIHSSGTTGQCF